MRFSLTFLLILYLASCNRKSGRNHMNYRGPDLTFEVFIFSKDGIDLLDSANTPSYRHSEIKVFSDLGLTDDITDSMINPLRMQLINQMDYPGSDYNRRYFLSLIAPIGNLTGTEYIEKTSYLALNRNDVDTITTKVVVTKNSMLLMEVSYNNIDLVKNYKVIQPLEKNINDRWVKIIK